MRTLRHGFSSRARRVALALVVATTAAAGFLSAGCETDDSSSPLPPAVKDATTDHVSSDGAGTGGDAESDASSPTPEASTGAEGGAAEAAAGGG